MTYTLIEGFCHILLQLKIIDTIENQQPQELTVSEEAPISVQKSVIRL
jgi:hypothetical protein